MKKLSPEIRLERLLKILSEDIATASDEEVLAACAELGIKPQMKGSLAMVGVRKWFYPYRPEIFPAEPNAGVLPTDGDPDDASRRSPRH